MKAINSKYYFFVQLLILIFCLSIPICFCSYITSNTNEKQFYDHQNSKKGFKFSNPQYSFKFTSHSEINISGNNEITSSGFNGSGIITDPYVITNIEIISNQSNTAIRISNTDAYVQISHCNLQNGTSGIFLLNVSNVEILNNTIMGNQDGISLSNTKNIIIKNNTIHNNLIGISLIELNYHSFISGNIIVNNTEIGINSLFSSSFTISLNNISTNGDYGILLTFSNNFTIIANYFSHNRLEAVVFNSTTNIVIVKWNNFLQNNLNGNSQASDNSIRAFFIYNYWDDWNNPDANNDDIVDNPYSIGGQSDNVDPFPLTQPISPNLASEKEKDPLFNMSSSLIIISGVVLASVGIASGGLIINKRRSIKRTSVNPSFQGNMDDTSKEIETPWILMFISPIIWLISQILYPPRVRKLSHSKVLNNPIRQKILQILKEREFEHYKALQFQLNCGISILEWHLQVLEDFSLIKSEKIGQYRIFFLSYSTFDRYKLEIFYSIRSEKALNIVSYLFNQSPDFYAVKSISKSLNMGITTAIYHCTKLVELGLFIKQVKTNNYKIVDDKREYLSWLINRHIKRTN